MDEIGDLPLQLQVNLLRFLQERKIVRIGGISEIPVDVRVIAATHVDLREAVKQGTFREDLYYRLRILQLHTPPLRERGRDIELLAWHYFNKFTGQQNKYKAKGFSSDAIHLLKQYNWPGNVRELMNCIQQAVVMSENRLLTPTDLKLERRNRHRAFQTLEQARVTADRESITSALHHTNNNISQACQLLNISRVSLYRLIGKYQLNCLDTTCIQCSEKGCRHSANARLTVVR